jgi:hypothetical protein
LFAAATITALLPSPLLAQVASQLDAQDDAQDARDDAVLAPSLSYVISKDWNASLAVEFLRRWYDADTLGFSRRDLEILPVWTIEYVIPESLFGGEKIANAFGRPALDFQGSYLKAWSNAPGLSFGQFRASVTLKMGWRL